MFAPFLVFSAQVSDVLMAVIGLGSVFGALVIVGLRDWRCFAIVALSYPLIVEFQTANLSGLIMLCAALVWRYRDRSVVAGVAAGMTVALKLFGWPLIVFLLVRRRYRAAAVAVGVAVLGIVLPWAAIGFAGMRGYPHLLSALGDADRLQDYSIAALFEPVLTWAGGQIAAGAVGGVLLLGAMRTRRSEVAFALCVAASLAFSPIVWPHYLVLLFVPLAIARPVFTPMWLLPLAFWVSPHAHRTHTWQVALVTAIGVAVVALAVGRPRPRAASITAAPSG